MVEEEIRYQLHEKIPKWGLTLLYLLPAIGLKGRALEFDILKKQGLLAGFLVNKESKTEFKDCLWLIFQPSNSSMAIWGLFSDIYKNLGNFLVEEMYSDRVIAICFRFTPEYKGIDEYFRLGKYSEMSKNFKGYEKNFVVGKEVLYQYYVLTSDSNYRYGLEKSLLLPRNLLLNTELDELPKETDLIFSLDNYK